jgi:hypothetical protein
MSDRTLLNELSEDNPPIYLVNPRLFARWIENLDFAKMACRNVLRFHNDGSGTYPRKASKRSVWKRLRRQGRNPGGYAT